MSRRLEFVCLFAGLAGCGSSAVLGFTVTETDQNVTVSPTGSVSVDANATQAFTITGKNGSVPSKTVGGTCPAGSWAGNVYTTGAIIADCSVAFTGTAASVTYQVTGGGDSREAISPSAPQAIAAGEMASFTVTANAGYTLSSTVGGSCPAGSWSGSVYTTGAISADCTVTFAASEITYQVTPSGDGRETVAPSATQTVADGSTQSFTVTADAGYTLSATVGGSCPAGSWSGSVYTTGAISADCTLTFAASEITYQVTPSGDGWETVAPSGTQTVADGSTQSFTVTANVGYTLSTTVGGTCPAGSWSGSTYTTGAISADCTVTFAASEITYQVTQSGDGWETVAPSAPQTVAVGSAQSFTVTANAGYTLSTTVGGTCPAGSWSGSTYTTGAISADCTVTFAASEITYQVTQSGDGWETVAPSAPQTVAVGSAQSFTVTANAGYTLSTTVGGTCPAGSWSGSTYTTGAISADCTVTFAASEITYQVIPSGDGWETVAPFAPQTVANGSTQSFTVTANAGYTLSATVGGTCPAGSWSGSTYTTGAISADCTLSFSAAPICDASCLTCSAPGATSCTSCASGGTVANPTPADVYDVQGQSFTPSVAGSGNNLLVADSSGNVQLASVTIAFVDPSTDATPSALYIYGTLPSEANAATGAGSLGTGTNDDAGTGTYVFSPPLPLPYSSVAYALLPGSYNINDDPDTYFGGSDLFPDGDGGVFVGSFGIGFTATFVGTTLTSVDGGYACE